MKREESGQEHEAETEEGRKTKEERFARILSCIPISRGVGKEELSYFTFKDIREGYLISVPLRKRQVPAIVVRAERAIFSKAELKSLPFGLRKVDAIKARSFLSPLSWNRHRKPRGISRRPQARCFHRSRQPRLVPNAEQAPQKRCLPRRETEQHNPAKTPRNIFHSYSNRRMKKELPHIEESSAKNLHAAAPCLSVSPRSPK